MNFIQFITSTSWWGKLIGAFFGYLMAGPAGALLGIIIGNFFDRGLLSHLQKPFFYYHTEKNTQVKSILFEGIFSFMGYIAKADHAVSPEAIAWATTVMKYMELNATQKRLAQHYFNQGKSAQFRPEPLLNSLYKALEHRPNLMKLFIDVQYESVKLNGLSPNKLGIMNTILSHMHLAPLYQQNRFSDDFASYSAYDHQRNQQNYRHNQSRYSSSKESYYHRNYQQTTHDYAYTVLGVSPAASKQDVKRAYRKLMSKHHPDKLIAQGASDSMIQVANEKTQKIRKAYEQICSIKGWT